MSYQGPSETLEGYAIGSVDNVALSKIYKSGTLHDQTMYKRQVYRGRISSGKQAIGIMWAQPYVLARSEHRERNYRVGVHHVEPTGSACRRSYWIWRTTSWSLNDFLHSSSIHLDM